MIIELEPPKIFLQDTVREVYHCHPHVCPRCAGKGWNWGCDPKTGEFIEEECPCCHGSGSMTALVTIEWKAAPREL